MFSELEKISSGTEKIKTQKAFINSVINFNQGALREERQSILINKILQIYLKLPGVSAASLFLLDYNSFEFYLGHSAGIIDLSYHQKIFDSSVEKGIIAGLLDKGQFTKDQFEDKLDIYFLPLISSAGVMGIIMLSAKKTKKGFTSTIQNYCMLHANQMVFLLHNSKLNEDIFNLEAEVEQKIAVKIEKIKQSKRDIQLILDSILIGVLIIEKSTGIVIDVNYAALRLMGIEREEIIGTKREKWHLTKEKNIYHLNTMRENFSEETILIDGENKHIPILRTLSNLLIGNKDIYLESFIDITERKENEEEIRTQSNLLKGVAEASSTLLTQTDFNSSINKALEILGLASDVDRVYIYQNHKDEESGKLFAVGKYQWSNERAAEVDKNLRKLSYDDQIKGLQEVLETNGSVQEKKNSQFKETLKSMGVNSALIVPIKIENKFWGFIGFDDSTKQRKWSDAEESILKVLASSIGGAIQRYSSRQQLIEAKERADKSDKLKSEFLAQVSHEIRTPVNSILSFSSILKEEFEGKLSDDLSSAFKIIENAGNRIIRTIDLILNMSELQIGIYEYNPTDFNIYEDIIVPIYDEFLRPAKTKKINLTINNDYGDTLITADRYSVSQIFNNLVDNAVKFTHKGGISINLKKCPLSQKLIVEVCDTGIGISNEYLPNLYNPFSQEENGYTRKYEGNGLGLALVKKYCEMNNFELQIESKKDVGSKFRVTFPAR